MARAYNNVLAMLLATIGLAIPLTANMHTPTLIDLFLRDRINRIVLSFMALGAAHVLWVDYLIGPEFAPTWAIVLAVYFAIAGWVILIPYFFYVVRFLEPSTVIQRYEHEVQDLAVKAKLILGAFFLETGRPAEAARVSDNLRDVAAAEIAEVERELLAAERVFFEVTDRQVNLEYVPPDRREPLRRFCAALTHLVEEPDRE